MEKNTHQYSLISQDKHKCCEVSSWESVRNRSCTLHDHSFRWWKDSVQWHGLLRPATFYIIRRRLDNRLQGRLDFFFLRNNINNTEKDRCVRKKEGINESIYIYISSTKERDTTERGPLGFSLCGYCCPHLHCVVHWDTRQQRTDKKKSLFERERVYIDEQLYWEGKKLRGS